MSLRRVETAPDLQARFFFHSAPPGPLEAYFQFFTRRYFCSSAILFVLLFFPPTAREPRASLLFVVSALRETHLAVVSSPALKYRPPLTRPLRSVSRLSEASTRRSSTPPCTWIRLWTRTLGQLRPSLRPAKQRLLPSRAEPVHCDPRGQGRSVCVCAEEFFGTFDDSGFGATSKGTFCGKGLRARVLESCG